MWCEYRFEILRCMKNNENNVRLTSMMSAWLIIMMEAIVTIVMMTTTMTMVMMMMTTMLLLMMMVIGATMNTDTGYVCEIARLQKFYL